MVPIPARQFPLYIGCLPQTCSCLLRDLACAVSPYTGDIANAMQIKIGTHVLNALDINHSEYFEASPLSPLSAQYHLSKLLNCLVFTTFF
jgi:hypothetical protein